MENIRHPKNHRIFKIFRGKSTDEDADGLVLEEGEMFYLTDKKELICGDGESPIKSLNKIGCVAKSPNGRLFSIEVSDDGKCKATPLKVSFSKKDFKIFS